MQFKIARDAYEKIEIEFVSPYWKSQMESLNAQLRAVKQQFPEQGDRIEQLYESDEDFRALCADYLLCMRHLLEIEKEFTEKKHTIVEYKSIRRELEKELHDFIYNG